MNMKVRKYITWAMLPLVLTACQNDEIVSGEPLQNGGVHTIKAYIDNSGKDSRAQIVFGNDNREEEFFQWNAGDKFTLVEQTGTDEYGNVNEVTYHEYTIDGNYKDNQPTQYADFNKTSGGSLVEGKRYWAIYPALDENGDCYLNQTLTDNSEESWKNYFKENMHMIARPEGTTSLTSPMSLKFEHLCSLIRISYTNNTGRDRILKSVGMYIDVATGFHIDTKTGIVPGASGAGGVSLEFTDGATVKAGTTADFYILYYPHYEYLTHDAAEPRNVIFLTDDEGNGFTTPELSLYVSEQAPDLLHGKGKRTWFNIQEDELGLTWKNKPTYDNIDSFEKLRYFVEEVKGTDFAQEITLNEDIEMERPLTINKHVRIRMNGHTIRIPGISESVHTAAFHLGENGHLYLHDGSLQGPDASSAYYDWMIYGEYNSRVDMTNMNIACGDYVANAIHANGQGIFIREMSNITVKEGNNAIHYDCARNSSNGVTINSFGKIVGNVSIHVANDAATSLKSDFFKITMADIKGDLILNENNVDDVLKLFSPISSVMPLDGEGWDRLPRFNAIQDIQNQLDEDGSASAAYLDIAGDVTFSVDPTAEEIKFDVDRITGQGTIIFKQLNESSETLQTLDIDCDMLGDEVEFGFEGNFRKELNVGTTQINRIVGYAENMDNVTIHLISNVRLTEPIVTSSSLQYSFGDFNISGMITIHLNGCLVNANLNGPAIIAKGGMLMVTDYSGMGGIETTNDAFQVGAPAEADNKEILFNLSGVKVTSSNGSAICFHSDEETDETGIYKSAIVTLDEGTSLYGNTEKGAMRYGTGYNAENTKITNWGTIEPYFNDVDEEHNNN